MDYTLKEEFDILSEAINSGADKNKLFDSFSAKMFLKTKNLMKVIDRDETKKLIDNTKGDFARFNQYSVLVNAEMNLSKAVNSTNDKVLYDAMSQIQMCRNNIVSYKMLFTKAFREGNLFFTNIYSSMACNYIMGLSYMIAQATRSYTNEYSDIVVTVVTDNVKKIKKSSIIGNIKLFNSLCKDGYLNKIDNQLKSSLNESANIICEGYCPVSFDNPSSLNESFGDILKIIGLILSGKANISSHEREENKKEMNDPNTSDERKKELGFIGKAGITLAVIAAIMIVVWFGASMVYYSRMKLAAMIEEIAAYMEVSSTNATDPKIKERQSKMAKKLKDLAEKIDLNSAVTEAKAESDTKKEVKDASEQAAKENTPSGSNSNNNSPNTNIELY